jgi:phosphoglycolate phosphatase
VRDIELVIFDLDGTLVNAYPAIIKSFNYVMQKLNYPKQGNLIIKRAVGWGDENLLRPFVVRRDLNKALLIYRRHHKAALLKGSCLLPGAKNTLRYLKNKGYKLAIASNRPTKFSLILINHLGIKGFFNYVLCADKLKHGKPDPEILNMIVRRLGVLNSRTLYVGDMVIDAKAGRAAKIDTVIVTSGSSTKKEIKKEKPNRIIAKINQLCNLL